MDRKSRIPHARNRHLRNGLGAGQESGQFRRIVTKKYRGRHIRKALVIGVMVPITIALSALASNGAVDSDPSHAVLAWGDDSSGQLGNWHAPASTSPDSASQLTAMKVAAGQRHSVALTGAGKVKEWGWNWTWCEIGSPCTGQQEPVDVPKLTDVVAISAGVDYSLALTSAGEIWQWAAGGTPGRVGAAGIVYTSIAAGGYHGMGLRSDGTVWTWGYGLEGALGNGSNSSSSIPVQALGLSEVVAIEAGLNHSLALTSTGTVWAWGAGAQGQLGTGSTQSSNVPVQVSGLSSAIAVSGGGFHSLALLSDGTVRAWGEGSSGQLGNGTFTRSTTPVLVLDIVPGVTQIAAAYAHNLAITSDGSIWSWGWNEYAQLGYTSQFPWVHRPRKVPMVVGASSISGGEAHSLAVAERPSGHCSGGTQVGDSYLLGVEGSIYVSQPTESKTWICARTGVPYEAVGGKLMIDTSTRTASFQRDV